MLEEAQDGEPLSPPPLPGTPEPTAQPQAPVEAPPDSLGMFRKTVQAQMPEGAGRCEFHPPGQFKKKCKCKIFVNEEDPKGRCKTCGHTANWHTGRVRPPTPPPSTPEQLAWEAMPEWKKKKEKAPKGGMGALARLKKTARMTRFVQRGFDLSSDSGIEDALSYVGKESKSARICMELAIKAQKEGKMDASEQHFKDALTLEPHNAEVCLRYGLMMMAQRRLADAEPLLLLAAQKGDSAEVERAKRAYRALGVLNNKAGSQRDTIGKLTEVLKECGLTPFADRAQREWDELQEINNQIRICGFMLERLGYPTIGKRIKDSVDPCMHTAKSDLADTGSPHSTPDGGLDAIVKEIAQMIQSSIEASGEAGGVSDRVATKCKQMDQIRSDLQACDQKVISCNAAMAALEIEIREAGQPVSADRLEALRRPSKSEAASIRSPAAEPTAAEAEDSPTEASPNGWFSKKRIATGALAPLTEISIPKDKDEDGLASELLTKLDIRDPNLEPLEVIADEELDNSDKKGMWKGAFAAVSANLASEKISKLEDGSEAKIAETQKMFKMLAMATASKLERQEIGRAKFEAAEAARKKKAKKPRKAMLVAAEISCCCLDKRNCMRKLMIPIVHAKWFDQGVLCVILLNCITLAMFDPLQDECSLQCIILELLERLFSIFFLAEMLLKMTALGTYGPDSYLDNNWNRIDCGIVVASVIDGLFEFIAVIGLIDFGVDFGGLRALRAFRAMRPLRAINRMPGVRVLVNLLLDTLPMLSSIAMLCGFMFCLFSIIGVQLWKGLLLKRCFHDDLNFEYMPANETYYCSPPENWGENSCPDSYSCIDGGENPGAGVIAFDNTLYAWYAIFQVVTVEQWVDVMFPLMESYSTHVWIYFVVLVFCGNFFAVNLFLIIINSQFSHTKARENALVKAKNEKREKILREREERAVTLSHNTACSVISELTRMLKANGLDAEAAYMKLLDEQATATTNRLSMVVLIDDVKGNAKYFMAQHERGIPGRLPIADTLHELAESLEWQLNAEDNGCVPTVFIRWWISITSFVTSSINNSKAFNAMQVKVMVIVDHPWFGYSVYIAIIANAITMGTEGTPVPESFRTYSNTFFTWFFTGEMIIKMIGLGCPKYFDDTMNKFDFFIVVTSILELMMAGGGALSVLRAFRLMRVFKLARFLPSLRKQLEVIAKSLGGAGDFSIVLLLFIFIFAVLGMYLFGGQFGFDDRGPYDSSEQYWASERANFDDPYWACITVFQILTMEDWPGVMEDAVRTSSPAAGAYFVAIIVMGQFILLSVFIAILLEGCAEMQAEEELRLVRELEEMKKTNEWAFSKVKLLMMGVVEARLADFFLIWKETAQFKRMAGFKLGNWRITALEQIRETHANQWAFQAIVRFKQDRSKNFRDECFLWWKLAVHDKTKASLLAEERNLCAMSHTDYTDVKESDFANSTTPTSKAGRFRKNSNKSKFGDEEDKALSSAMKVAGGVKKKVSITRAETVDESMMQTSSNPLLDSDDDDMGSSSYYGRGCGSGPPSPEPVTKKGWGADWFRFKNNPSMTSSDVISAIVCPQSPPTSPSALTEQNSSSGFGIGGGNSKKNENSNKKNSKTRRELEKTLKEKAKKDKTAKVHPLKEKPQIPRLEAKKSGAFDKWASMEDDGKARKKAEKVASGVGVGALAPPPDVAAKYAAEQNAILAEEEEHEESCWFQIRRRDYALCCFPRGNCVRRCCEWLSAHPAFDNTVLVVIGIQSILMAWERPSIEDDSTERMVLDLANQAFVLLFSFELLIKVVAHGLVIGPTSYLSNDWNKLDFFVVLISWADLLLAMFVDASGGILGVLRVLRLLRALRPLRAIKRAPKLRLVVKTVMASVRPISETMLVCAVFIFIFGVLGVQLFAQKYSYCNAPEAISTQCMYEESQCITTKAQCIQRGYLWTTSKLNFNNLLNAAMTIFFLCTGDGWVTIMHQGVDGVGEDMQPKRNNSQISALFFVCAVIIGQFFLLNLFIGVVVDNFSRMAHLVEHQEAEGVEPDAEDDFDPAEAAWAKHEVLRQRQEERAVQAQEGKKEGAKLMENPEYAQCVQEMDAAKEQMPALEEETKDASSEGNLEIVTVNIEKMKNLEKEVNRLQSKLHEISERESNVERGCLHTLVTSLQFEMTVSIVIVANIVVMAIEFYDMPVILEVILMCVNGAFTVFFIVEAILKMAGLGCGEYWSSGWNRFDFFVIIVSVASLALELSGLDGSIGINPTLLRVLRVFRLTRLLRVFRASPGLQALLATVATAIEQVGSLFSLMLLIFFVYACAGVDMFGCVGCDTHACQGFGVHSNFENFLQAMLALFRISTLDNGYGMLLDTMRTSPQCDDSVDCMTNCCTTPWLAALYFVTFVMGTKLVLLNVVVAILMVQLNVANEDVLLDSLRDQSLRLEEMAQDEDNEELLEELGLEKERKISNFQSDIMKEAQAREAELKDLEEKNRLTLGANMGKSSQTSPTLKPSSKPSSPSLKPSSPSSLSISPTKP